jgi:cyanate permease
MAATGPVAFRWLRDHTEGWTIPMMSPMAVAIMQAVVGVGAGQKEQV